MKDSNTQIIYNRFSGFVAYQKTNKGIKIIYSDKSYNSNIGGVQ
tara:strand:+ start:394 stop:525 length:132 start_codon:yes stop_codon:yes gene_type:complete